MLSHFSRVLFLFAAFAITSLALAQSNDPTTQVNRSSGARSSASEVTAEKVIAGGDPLLRVLISKGVLTADEARAIVNLRSEFASIFTF